jgi:hypothetical protein
MFATKKLRYAVGLLVSLGLSLMGGCATPGARDARLPPGSVAVVAARFTPETSLNLEEVGKKGAAGGAAEGAAAATRSPTVGSSSPPLGAVGPVLWLAVLPFAALAGAIAGDIAAVESAKAHALTEEQLQQLNQAVSGALVDLNIQETMAQQVVVAAKERPIYRLSYVTGIGPGTKDERPDYSELTRQGYDSILELTVTKVLFSRKTQSKRVALDMHLRARAIQTAPMKVLAKRDFEYKTRPRPFSDWTAAEGLLLRQDFEQSYNWLANEVVATMFSQPTKTSEP